MGFDRDAGVAGGHIIPGHGTTGLGGGTGVVGGHINLDTGRDWAEGRE
jgi:hypothetical protein